MKVALDTSILVAGLVRAHPRHAEAAAWLTPRPRTHCSIAPHAIAETWATLTAMPLEPRVTGDQAKTLIYGALTRVDVTPVGRDVYVRAMDRCIDHGLRSGAIYDALHVIAAEVAKADVILTLNVGDFERLVTTPGPSVRTP